MCQQCVQRGITDRDDFNRPCKLMLMKRKPETKEINTKKIEVQNECQNNYSVKTTSEEMSEMAKLYKYIQQQKNLTCSGIYSQQNSNSINKQNKMLGESLSKISECPEMESQVNSSNYNEPKQFSKVKPTVNHNNNQAMSQNKVELPNMNIEVPRHNLSYRDLREDVRLLLNMQNFYMQIVSKQNESVICSLNKLYSSVDGLKNSQNGPQNSRKQNNINKFKNYNENADNCIYNKTNLLRMITNEENFKYRIVLKNPIVQPLVKERNFRLNLALVDIQTGEVVKNSSKIFLLISVYSSENPPQLVEYNTAGNCIVKGHSGKFLQSGECNIEKIQIREVTSHFRNGWVFVVIKPAIMEKNHLKSDSESIIATKIEPLILENIVIKAKNLVGKKALKTDQEQALNVKIGYVQQSKTFTIIQFNTTK